MECNADDGDGTESDEYLDPKKWNRSIEDAWRLDLDVNQEEIEGEDNTLLDADDDCESELEDYCDSNNE